MNTNTDNTSTRGRLEFVSANAKGTGSAIRMNVFPASGDAPGFVLASLARQDSVTGRSFNWTDTVDLRLDRSDLSQILQVLRGMQESVNDGRGLYHQGDRGCSLVFFNHQIEPHPGYRFSVDKVCQTGEQRKASYFFGQDEAFTLMLALERAMFYVCFGVPQV